MAWQVAGSCAQGRTRYTTGVIGASKFSCDSMCSPCFQIALAADQNQARFGKVLLHLSSSPKAPWGGKDEERPGGIVSLLLSTALHAGVRLLADVGLAAMP